jgi:hypothetical protein
MKLQFSTRALLIVTAMIAICCSAVLTWKRYMVPGWDIPTIATGLEFDAAIWVPLVFAAYSIGRRTVTWKLVAVFALAEATAVAAAYYHPIPSIWPSKILWPTTNF